MSPRGRRQAQIGLKAAYGLMALPTPPIRALPELPMARIELTTDGPLLELYDPPELDDPILRSAT